MPSNALDLLLGSVCRLRLVSSTCSDPRKLIWIDHAWASTLSLYCMLALLDLLVSAKPAGSETSSAAEHDSYS